VLLEQGHRAITLNQLSKDIDKLLGFIAIFNFPMAFDAKQLSSSELELALKQLSVTGVITIAEEGVEVLYMIPHGAARTAAYYRNGLIQFFITSAIGDVAILAVTGEGDAAIAQFHHEALRIRDLLKYEFFFEGSEEFIKVLEREFDARRGDWRSVVQQGPEAIHKMLRAMDLILGHGTLRPFIESYLVFARALSLLGVNDEVQASKLIASSLALGKQRVLQQRIHCEESVSQSYFENAAQIADSRGLFEQTEAAADGRQQLLQELRDVTSNVRFLASISETQRLTERIAKQHEEL
jgi:glycerol-3-phosphate O-acyltransferase